MKDRSLRHRSPLLWITLPMTVGLVAGRVGVGMPAGLALTLAALCAGIAVGAAWREARGWAPAFVAALVLAGIGAYGMHRNRLDAWERLPPREVQLKVRCGRLYPSKDRERFAALVTVTEAERHVAELRGQPVYVSLSIDPRRLAPIAGSELRVRGVLERLPVIGEPYSFEGYLTDLGINFRLARGEVLGESGRPGAYRLLCAAAERRIHSILGIGIARERPDLAGVLRAMLLGRTAEMSQASRLLFMRSGTLHLFAISGLHIVAIALALNGLLAFARVPQLPRFAAGMVALWFYVDVTGAAPSAVRALFMVALVELAFVVRRAVNPLATLTTAWLLVLLVSPLQFFTASFQMSYGIVASLILVGVPLYESIRSRWRPFEAVPADDRGLVRRTFVWLVDQVLSAGALGASASLVGLVAGVAFFRLLTPGSILVNLVMIPVSTLVIYAGLASLLCGLAGATLLASVFNHTAALVLLAMERFLESAMCLPGMYLAGQFRWSVLGGCGMAAVLALALACYARAAPNRPGRWIAPFALCTALLLLGVRYG